jgi:3D (Asp-Asp-Asp) domain-containing protein
VADGLKLAITPDPVRIPANATLSGGKILTESRLALELTDAIGPVGGVVLTLRSNRPTLDTIDGPKNATGADGLTEAFVSTRNQASQSTIDSTTPLVWTEPKGVITWLPARYVTPFHVTCYITALESEYSVNPTRDATRYTWCGSYVPPSGKTYRDAFMKAVKFQGSGLGDGGEIVQYLSSQTCYYISPCPTTASGACAQVGTTVAVDDTVIPFRSSIAIDTLGPRLAQDRGGRIQGYDIDEYGGIGKPQCSGWTNPDLGVDFQSY